MKTDNIPALSEWLATLPRWKLVLFHLCYLLPAVGRWALVLFGYTRARRDSSLPRNAQIER